MSIEKELFNRLKLKENSLIPFGFTYENNVYKYTRKFMSGCFRTDIVIDKSGNISGKVYDLKAEEEYTNFRMENIVGEFVNAIKNEYIKILKDIADSCYEKEYFIFSQTRRIGKALYSKYNVTPEFLWDSLPSGAVFRNARSNKWFSLIMCIDRGKIISGERGEAEVLNIKLNGHVPEYINKKGIYPAYHMNKNSWVSIILDDTLDDEEVLRLIHISYELSCVNGEWIVPANPKYYDVTGAFNGNDTITWKQSSNIIVGDTIYLYVAAPYSAIMYKCTAVETDIPYDYKDKNLCINKVMKIKLIKRYDKDEFTFKKLNEYGINAVRGPRNVNLALSKKLNN